MKPQSNSPLSILRAGARNHYAIFQRFREKHSQKTANWSYIGVDAHLPGTDAESCLSFILNRTEIISCEMQFSHLDCLSHTPLDWPCCRSDTELTLWGQFKWTCLTSYRADVLHRGYHCNCPGYFHCNLWGGGTREHLTHFVIPSFSARYRPNWKSPEHLSTALVIFYIRNGVMEGIRIDETKTNKWRKPQDFKIHNRKKNINTKTRAPNNGVLAQE